MTEDIQAAPETPAPITAETPAEAPPTAPKATPLSPALRGFLGGVVGGVAVSLLAAGGLAAAWPMVKGQLVHQDSSRLLAVERELDSLSQRPVSDGSAPARGDAAALAAVNQRLASLETAQANPPVDPRIAALSQKLDQANAEIESLRRAMPPEGAIIRLADRAEAAEKVARDIANRHDSAQALLLVAGQLRDAVDRGEPYEVELRAAKRVASADESAPLDALAATAATGIPRKQSLSDAFPALASEIVNASVAPAEGSFWQRALNKLTSLVTWRRIDGKGEDTASVVSRAESRVKEGDLAKAVQELSTLQGRPAETAAPWVKAASARIAADRSLSELSALAAADTAKSGG